MARHFEASRNQYCEIQSELGLVGPPFWVAVWFRPLAHQRQAVWFLGSSRAQAFYHALAMDGEGRVAVRSISQWDGLGEAWSSASLALGAWHHLVGVWESAHKRHLHVAGQSFTNLQLVRVGYVDRMSVGRLGRAIPSDYLTGEVAELVVARGVPTAQQIAALRGGWPAPCVVARTAWVGYWALAGTDEEYYGRWRLEPQNDPLWRNHPPVLYRMGARSSARSNAVGETRTFRVVAGKSCLSGGVGVVASPGSIVGMAIG